MTEHRCRWFQLSLKSLFLLTLVVAAFLAGYSLATKEADTALQVERDARKESTKAYLEFVRATISAETECDGALSRTKWQCHAPLTYLLHFDRFTRHNHHASVPLLDP